MFEDKTLVCRECGAEFVFTASEQQFYAEKGFQNEPGRCPACRDVYKRQVLGLDEEGQTRMVRTPWFDHDIPFEQAAEIGTRKVIREHSTIGVVVLTDGSITDIPRSAYLDAEERVIGELKALEKPFVVLLNSTHPQDAETRRLRESLEKQYAVPVMALDVMNMREEDINALLESVLFEFPLSLIHI